MLFLGRTTIRVRGLKSNTTETAVVGKVRVRGHTALVEKGC
jgi:hypothetical protein